MKEYLPVLRKSPLFSDIEPSSVEAMLHCLGAKLGAYEKGQRVLAEGDPALYLGIVLTGSVQITRVDYYGNRSILGHIGPAQLFGESFACAGVEALPVDVTAAEDTTVLLIDARRVTRTCSSACALDRKSVV